MSGMTDTHFEVRDQALPHRAPLASTTDYDAAMRAVTDLRERFWAQLDANGEGGRDARLSLSVVERTPDEAPRLRAAAVIFG
ncbi:hypothetical protein acdb102_23000 [Acidothermaceae bacterium B102]|nr:hypothetical protein acdb102_23000 [Acidothermaceae bacterium B102]